MRHAEVLTDRILFLEGLPNYQRLFALRIGETAREQFNAVLCCFSITSKGPLSCSCPHRRLDHIVARIDVLMGAAPERGQPGWRRARGPRFPSNARRRY
jgi:hypothetical protein